MKALKYLFIAVALSVTAFATRPKDEARTVTTPNSDDFLLIDGLTGGTGKLSAPLVVLTNGSYANPSWLPSLAWSKVTGTPTTLAGYGITDSITLQTGSYANPAWITSLAYSKLTGTPTIDTLLPTQTGNSGKFLTTNGTSSSWAAISGGGDMLRSVYDTNLDGVVDVAALANAVTFANVTGKPTNAAGYSIVNGATIDLWGAKALPVGAVVGTSDTQTLTNKTISGASNTLSALPASGISGVIPIANLATGTPNGAKFIRDDGTLATPGGSGTVTASSGALTASALMVGNGTTDSKVLASLGTTTTLLHGNAAGLPTFGAVNLTSDVTGVLPIANIATGTPSGSKFVRDDGTLAVPAGAGGYSTIQNAGSAVTTRTTVNFAGASVSAVDNAGSTRTDVTITGLHEIGFGVDGAGSVVPTGLRVKRVMQYACTIVGWGIVADQSGSITMDIRKGTPSSGTVTTSTITASATPALSSAQVATSSTLTGWTTAVAAGDVLELVITGTPSAVTSANLTLKITR